jgi:hypothetical protein
MIDYTINIVGVVQIVAILVGGLAVLWTLKTDVNTLKVELASMQSEIKKLGDILINLADIRGEIRVLGTRITANEQDIRELRHGHGFVQGRTGVDREYAK